MSIALSSNVRARVIASHEMHRRFKGRRIDATRRTQHRGGYTTTCLSLSLSLHTHSFTHTKSSLNCTCCRLVQYANISWWSVKKRRSAQDRKRQLTSCSGKPKRNMSKVVGLENIRLSELCNARMKGSGLPLSLTHSLSMCRYTHRVH